MKILGCENPGRHRSARVWWSLTPSLSRLSISTPAIRRNNGRLRRAGSGQRLNYRFRFDGDQASTDLPTRSRCPFRRRVPLQRPFTAAIKRLDERTPPLAPPQAKGWEPSRLIYHEHWLVRQGNDKITAMRTHGKFHVCKSAK